MKIFSKSFRLTNVNKYRLKSILFIAVIWTLTDYAAVLMRDSSGLMRDTIGTQHESRSLWVRELLIFCVSLIMGYLFVFKLKKILRNYPLWLNYIAKSTILLSAAFLISFILHFADSIAFRGLTSAQAVDKIMKYVLHRDWLIQKIVFWMVMFFITQLFLIINEKYSPGVFTDILLGRYLQPKIETRIVMFIDLKDSTPIAEKLGHVMNFKYGCECCGS